MSVEPTGYTGKIVSKARTMLANSATFQAQVKAADAAAALRHIYGFYLFDRDRKVCPPFAMIYPALGAAPMWEKVAVGSRNRLRPSGAVDVALTDWISFGSDGASGCDSEFDSEMLFLNFMDGVAGDLAAMSAVNDNLALSRIEFAVEPVPDRPEESTPDNPGTWNGVLRLVVER
ncbi:MAG TPA: hypothetical protein VGE52_01805 [Pirellulales bacterium]